VPGISAWLAYGTNLFQFLLRNLMGSHPMNIFVSKPRIFLTINVRDKSICHILRVCSSYISKTRGGLFNLCKQQILNVSNDFVAVIYC
jgi:hypothetical protein